MQFGTVEIVEFVATYTKQLQFVAILKLSLSVNKKWNSKGLHISIAPPERKTKRLILRRN